MMSYCVVFMGCGNIGSRLLQSVAKVQMVDESKTIDVIVYEPFANAKEVAEQRFHDANVSHLHKLQFVDSPSELPATCDLAIVPTDARNRFSALSEMLENVRPNALLLEKFLFTKFVDYAEARTLLGELASKTYVNTSRSAWDGYVEMRHTFGDETITHMDVSGPDWNLASNGIHFLALFEFLTGTEIDTVEVEQVFEVRESKRGGYKEFAGVLRAKGKTGGTIRLESNDLLQKKLSVRFETTNQCTDIKTIYEVSEAEGEFSKVIGNQDASHSFKMNHASELEHVIEGLLLEKPVHLPRYAESSELHLKVMHAMGSVFSPGEIQPTECPVS